MEQSLTNMRYVRTLLERHGFHFSKKLGQNFLINPDVCPRIAEMGNAKPEHGILEIGTGIGTLTAELAKRAEKVTAVEVDARLFPILEETVGQYENLHIIHQDILKCDIPALLEQEFGTMPVSVCANLPYYITAPIGNNYGYGAERSCREADRSSWNTGSRSNYGCRAVLWNGHTAVFCFEGQLFAAAECRFCGDSNSVGNAVCGAGCR